MSDPLLPTTAAGRAGPATLTTGWQPGQKLQATVVNGGNGSKLLRINGNLYAPLQHLQIDAGRTLTLTVKSLSPYIELGLLNRSLTAGRPGVSPAIILSQSIQHGPGQAQNTGSGLLRFMAFLQAPATQPLPPTAAALLAALTERLTVPALLNSPDTLRAAVRDASLLLDSGQAATRVAAADNALAAQLLQLVRSLGNGVTGQQQRMLDSDGLALYQRVSRVGNEYPLLAARELGEELLQRSLARSPDREASELFERRWLFELPVQYQDRVGSVTVRFFEENPRRRPRRVAPAWAADFEFELPVCGELKVALEVRELLVWLSVTCANRTVARQLQDRQAQLQQRLARFGLQLASLNSVATAQHTGSRSGATGPAPTAAVASVRLRNFAMVINDSTPTHPADGIPDPLYCAMAAFFGYIFAVENGLS